MSVVENLEQLMDEAAASVPELHLLNLLTEGLFGGRSHQGIVDMLGYKIFVY